MPFFKAAFLHSFCLISVESVNKFPLAARSPAVQSGEQEREGKADERRADSFIPDSGCFFFCSSGTGKTSTLVKYAEKFADLNFLYVTFNKAVAERGKSVFPRNVTCKTFHSLAFGSVGKQ